MTYEDRLEELLKDTELSNNAMYDILVLEFPGRDKNKIWEDCKNKEFYSQGRDPIHS